MLPSVDLPPPSLRPPAPPHYRPTRWQAALVVVTSGVSAIAFAVSAAADVNERQVLGRLGPGPGSFTAATVERADDVRVISSGIALGAMVVSIGALAAWSHRLYRNVSALGVPGLRFTAGWAAGAWFVPLLNLVRPKQIVDELWRASDPTEASDWRRRPVTPLIHVWWGVWIGALVLNVVGAQTRTDVDDLRRWLITSTVSKLGFAVAAVLAVIVVLRTTRRHHDLAARLGILDSKRRTGSSATLAIVPGVMAAMAFTGSLIVLLASRETHDETTAGSDGSSQRSTKFAFALEVADCFDSPGLMTTTNDGESGEIGAVDVTDCDDPHAFEVIAKFSHAALPDAPYPGVGELDEFGIERCLESFDEAIGTPFLQSSLDMASLSPTPDSWRFGDRTIQCIAMRVDGADLRQDVLGSGM